MQLPDAAYSTIQVGGPRAKRRGVALVDAADVDAMNAYHWHINSNGYAARNIPRGEGKRGLILLHRQLLGLVPGDGIEVDHIHGNKLDNRRENLRLCTDAQNQQNLHHCGPRRGATWHPRAKRWMAQVGLEYKNHYLGYYDTEEEAAEVAAAFRRQHMPYSRDAREAA